MAIVKNVIKRLQELNPDEVIYIHWLNKSDVLSDVLNREFTDSDDNPYPDEVLEKVVDEKFMSDLTNMIESNDYLWDTFADNYRDTLDNLFLDHIKDVDVEKEIQDMEQELWESE